MKVRWSTCDLLQHHLGERHRSIALLVMAVHESSSLLPIHSQLDLISLTNQISVSSRTPDHE